MARLPKRFGFMCTELDDPRRITLRQSETARAYRERGSEHDLIEIAHALTKLRPIDRWDIVQNVRLFEQPFMQTVQYTQDRVYPLQPLTPLPPPRLPDTGFGALVRTRRSTRRFGGAAIGLDALSALLFSAAGETGMLAVADDGEGVSASLRPIPSAGALHPTELFVVALRAGELAPGAYHYDAPSQGLECVKTFEAADGAALLPAFPIHPAIVDLTRAAAIVLVASTFWRARAKYGARGYRYCLQEAGCACQNLGLAATALGLGHVVLGGFYDDELHACVDLDGVDRAVTAAVAVGTLPAAADDGERRHG